MKIKSYFRKGKWRVYRITEPFPGYRQQYQVCICGSEQDARYAEVVIAANDKRLNAGWDRNVGQAQVTEVSG